MSLDDGPSAFEPILRLQSSPELFEKYGELILNNECYLQTELGHGTNVGRLETTATYLPDTREFEIHSPTLSSTKWSTRENCHPWSRSGQAHSAGREGYGATAVLGSAARCRVLPGLTIGDTGPRVMGGFAAVDNGFARFDHVRIPKENMLSKLAGVKRRRKLTAIAWSRRQDGLLVALHPTRGFDSLAKGLPSGDISQLAEVIMISGLKVLVSNTRIQDIEAARRSMGGHGYSGFSDVGKIYAEYLPAATYEGENYALDGQVLRAALKSFRGICSTSSPPTFSPTSAYLRLLLAKNLLPPELSPASWRDPAVPILLLEWRAALLAHEAAQTVPIGQPDSTPRLTQRVSRAVTEVFVAGQATPHVRATQHPNCGSPLLLCAVLEIIGLTDAFGFTDWELDSALGVFDGRAYEAFGKRVQDEPLNQTELTEAYAVSAIAMAIGGSLTSGLQQSMKPILLRGQRLAAAEKKSRVFSHLD
ncbi:peroxisomal oxidase [Mycena amicta]|nr:peroxisomal oxidase [Mycena amicta]